MSVDPGMILSVASTAMQAFGAISQGNAAHASGMYDAAVSEENARQSELDGAMAGEDIRRDGRQVEGEAIANMGANGIVLGTGSALDALRESAYNNEMDVLATRYQAATQARAYRLDAESQRRGAKDARKAGFMSAAAGIITGATNGWERAQGRAQQARAVAAGESVREARRPPARRTSVSGMRMPLPFGPADWLSGYDPQTGLMPRGSNSPPLNPRYDPRRGWVENGG